ncbi:MAG: tryptophan-rich sensory protein [Novosphingobium sp.]|nr:tryptophan-rich sensory protein [Novosphingobium sp.]MCP5403035.1 tryptophan-rich sensory protein [Novosphingobium sp.]
MSEIASAGQLRASLLRWTLFLVPGILLLGYLSAEVSMSGPENPWFAALNKPSLYPPPIVFGAVWTVLYTMMGFALAIVASARGAPGRGLAVAAFCVQLALNLAWSPLFFGARQITAALILLVVLDVAVVVTIVLFRRVRLAAALLLLPYLAWILFATVLNWEFRIANPGADGREVSGAATRVEF